MTHCPLVRYPDRCVILAPQYAGSVEYYAVMARYGMACIDNSLRYDKRFKSVHRMDIAGTSGRQTLTVPVSRPSGASMWSEVLVSPHNEWWSEHMTALESAYGRTPYFEFYAPYLRQIICRGSVGKAVTDLDAELDALVRRLLGLTTIVSEVVSEGVSVDDMRRAGFDTPVPMPDYYQIRAARLGFMPNLSVLDLLFNLGPEAAIYLKDFDEKR